MEVFTALVVIHRERMAGFQIPSSLEDLISEILGTLAVVLEYIIIAGIGGVHKLARGKRIDERFIIGTLVVRPRNAVISCQLIHKDEIVASALIRPAVHVHVLHGIVRGLGSAAGGIQKIDILGAAAGIHGKALPVTCALGIPVFAGITSPGDFLGVDAGRGLGHNALFSRRIVRKKSTGSKHDIHDNNRQYQIIPVLHIVSLPFKIIWVT